MSLIRKPARDTKKQVRISLDAGLADRLDAFEKRVRAEGLVFDLAAAVEAHIERLLKQAEGELEKLASAEPKA